MSTGYCEYDTIKIKLRLDDNSMRDEIQIIMQDINDLINNRVRAKLGSHNIYGAPIILPLTFNTSPKIPLELKGIANDLVVAKIRLQNSEKPMLWDSAVRVLDNYLEKVYGWTRDKPFEPIRTLTTSPVTGVASAVVTITGSLFEPNTELTFSFDGIEVVTTPVKVTTDNVGDVVSFTFVVPTPTATGKREIKLFDSLGGIIITFLVT